MNQVSRSGAKSGASVMLLSATLMCLSGGVLAAPQAGDRVLGQWKDGYWYPATVQQVQGGAVKLRFDDGDTAQASPRQLASIDWTKGTRVECNWKNQGKYFRGVISARQKDQLSIAYDDGDKETTRIGACRSSKATMVGSETFNNQPARSNTNQKPLQNENKSNSTIPSQATTGHDALDKAIAAGDFRTARSIAERLANSGDITAQTNLGIMLMKGDGGPKDPKRGFELLRKASEAGNHIAMQNAGYAYESGEGVQKDYRRAMDLYSKSAELGNINAMRSAGFLALTQSPSDKAAAYSWFSKCSNKGDTDCMFNLATMAVNGDGVSKNPKLAQGLFSKASAAGHAASENSLGFHADKGTFGRKDAKAAIAHYRKAASMGSSMAMFNLGASYAAGDGVPRNYRDAHSWYRKAANAGHSEATRKVAKLDELLRKDPTLFDSPQYESRSPAAPQHGHYVSPHEAPMEHEKPMAHQAPMPHEAHLPHEAPRLYK